MSQQIIIAKDFTFEASHVLPRHPGKCSRLHGHSWKLTVAIVGPVSPETGFVADYGHLKKLVERLVVDRLDHQHLGQGDLRFETSNPASALGPDRIYDVSNFLPRNFYPSSENLVLAIRDILLPEVAKNHSGIQLAWVKLHETCTSMAMWVNDQLGEVPDVVGLAEKR